MRYFYLFLLLILLLPFGTKASLSASLTGRILLDVERNGEAWYVYPEDNKRYYLGRPADAFSIMRELGLGISELNFQKIPQAGMNVEGDKDLARRLAGKIILQTEKNGEAWYIYPLDLKKYYLGRPADAFSIMRELGLGISRYDLALVHKSGYNESIDENSSYEYKKKVEVNGEDLYVDVVKIRLDDPDLEIITDTASENDCENNCPAKSLADFVFSNDGFAGMNGSYFDTSEGKKNYSFAPVYRSSDGTMINEGQLKYWTTGPMIAFDENNRFYYFKDSREFPYQDWYRSGEGVEEAFEDTYGTKLQAAISNRPRLVENGMNALLEWEMDEKQMKTKSNRNAIGYKASEKPGGKGTLYLTVARNSTVVELADIMKSLGVDYALNMDGGYSSALIYNGEYMFGPGRDVVNAIIFSNDER